jgi:hypothetical protein
MYLDSEIEVKILRIIMFQHARLTQLNQQSGGYRASHIGIFSGRPVIGDNVSRQIVGPLSSLVISPMTNMEVDLIQKPIMSNKEFYSVLQRLVTMLMSTQPLSAEAVRPIGEGFADYKNVLNVVRQGIRSYTDAQQKILVDKGEGYQEAQKNINRANGLLDTLTKCFEFTATALKPIVPAEVAKISEVAPQAPSIAVSAGA